MSRFLLAALWVVGALLFGQGIYMGAKAKLAQVLIASSWEQRTSVSPPPKPWWWADTRAIAKLDVPRLEKSVFVMQDDSGESLAFGPGHMSGSAKPATGGHVMIAGHRDSHFAFLKNVEVGDIISTHNFQSDQVRYRVVEMYVFDNDTDELNLNDTSQLTLVTCYPFDSLVPGGPLRYIVNAEAVDSDMVSM